MKILYISNTQRIARPYYDPSVRYRCFNFAFSIEEIYGFKTYVITQAEINTSLSDNFDVFIFHRPSFSKELADLIQHLKVKGKLFFADYDDLIFDVNNCLDSSIYVSGRADARQTCAMFDRNSCALSLFDNITVSTTSLKSRINKIYKDKNVSVIHNTLSMEYVEYAKRACLKNKIKMFSIGYFSGTNSHDKDFKMVEDVIIKNCLKHENFNVLIVGPLKISQELINTGKVTQIPITSYFEMIDYISKCHSVIAPLEASIFNDCKSGLKFFESSIFNTKVFATPIPDIDKFEHELLVKCRSKADWDREITLFAEHLNEVSCEVYFREDVAILADIKVEIKKYEFLFNNKSVNRVSTFNGLIDKVKRLRM